LAQKKCFVPGGFLPHRAVFGPPLFCFLTTFFLFDVEKPPPPPPLGLFSPKGGKHGRSKPFRAPPPPPFRAVFVSKSSGFFLIQALVFPLWAAGLKFFPLITNSFPKTAIFLDPLGQLLLRVPLSGNRADRVRHHFLFSRPKVYVFGDPSSLFLFRGHILNKNLPCCLFGKMGVEFFPSPMASCGRDGRASFFGKASLCPMGVFFRKSPFGSSKSN